MRNKIEGITRQIGEWLMIFTVTCCLAGLFAVKASGQTTWLGGNGFWEPGNWSTGICIPGLNNDPPPCSNQVGVDVSITTAATTITDQNGTVNPPAALGPEIGNLTLGVGDTLIIPPASGMGVDGSISNSGTIALQTVSGVGDAFLDLSPSSSRSGLKSG